MNLVETARSVIGDHVALSSDFIAGFCGETEEDHALTLKLIKEVGYDQVKIRGRPTEIAYVPHSFIPLYNCLSLCDRY